KTGKENGLIGYWLLDEGKGTVGTDKARSRHLTVETDWYIYPQGKSATLSGSDYLSINSTEFAFSKYDDFSIEFWFRGADQSNVTLLSVGHGINDIELSHKLSIAINANKELVLRSLGEENVITTNNVLTDQWHHLALTVKRGGTSNVYIDGTLTKQFGAEVIGSVGGDAYHFGASVYTRNDNGTMLPVTEDFFTGSLDDIRVWNSVLSSGVIELNMNNKLRGDEAGLLAYYPFEKGILPSAEDLVSGSLSADGFVSGENTPAIKNARSVEKVLFTYVTSNNKIVINLDDNYKQRVEGTTLEISVEDVYDMYDNKSDVQKWTVYVSRNPLMWMDDAIDLTIEEGTSETFTATIVNKSAEATDYIVENLPDWLTVNQPQGSLKPAATKDLTFTVSKGLNIGSYEAAVSLTGTSELSEKLPINLKVTGERPDWAVNQGDFSQYMSVYGNIQISGAPQEDKDDILAAFIGELCVGVANPIYIQSQNAYSVFMSVYGNDEHDGLNVTFKLWDASTGRIYPQVLTTQSGSGITVVFEGNETKYAKTNSPVIFNAEDVIEQQIALGAGWNWFSVNVKNDNPDLLTQFKDKIGANGTQIKAHNGNYLQPFVQGNSVTWAGTLTSLSVKETYLASLNEAQVLKMSGQPAKTTESDIVLNKGWNWVGYIPQLTTTVSHALSGFEAKSGDQIKSQSAFSIYDENNGWFGTLQYMQPGKGYMYYSENTNPVTFYYPNVTASLRSSEDLRSTQEETYWENDFRRFANNMTVTSIALLDDVIQESDQVEIAAFVGDDCRGTVLLSYQDIQGLSNNYLGFLMVYGESGDQIKFRMYDHTTGKEYIGLNEAVSFKANNSHGNLADPFELRFRSGTYLDDIEVNSVSIYPNPVETILNIKHNQDKIDRLEVADVSGRTVMTRIDFSEKTLNVSDLTDGLYLLKLTYNNETVVLKFNKK
ncbi:T9SS type A sorting domain-containing protein, partial [Bacteroidales bacterium OttesenSCG-928-A17]|nr:T9SS type A sorting domain-containing protein [Bacteroidales bacterium OttesenSCG-928-A17]